MRGLLLGVGGLVATLLLPLLLISALLGSLPSTPAGAAPDLAASVADLPVPAPFTGADTDCTATDPTGGRCLTPATRHAHDEVVRAFGPPGAGQPIRSAGCWDAHAWNPRSDHPRGRACDYFPTTAGTFPAGTDLANGWALAEWLRAHADVLRVKYLIWQGRFWSPTTPDLDGWGRPYTGGGVYDATDATGGHYDHIHLSIASLTCIVLPHARFGANRRVVGLGHDGGSPVRERRPRCRRYPRYRRGVGRRAGHRGPPPRDHHSKRQQQHRIAVGRTPSVRSSLRERLRTTPTAGT